MAVVVAMPAVWTDWTPLRVFARRVAVTLRAAIIDYLTTLLLSHQTPPPAGQLLHQPMKGVGTYDHCCFDARTVYQHNYRTLSGVISPYKEKRNTCLADKDNSNCCLHHANMFQCITQKSFFSPLLSDSLHVLTPFDFCYDL